MPYGTVNADVIQTSTSGGILGAGNASIMKNRIINGAMVIDQRNAGASVTVNGFTAYATDRFLLSFRPAYGTATGQQVSDAPVGFANSLKLTQTSSATVNASEIYSIQQKIEGYNIADLNWGTANAKTITVSFWVKSSVTGTYGFTLQNINATRRSYVTTYTVSAANTWEQKTVTIAGDTTGTWETTNSTGIQLWWDLGSGSDYQTSTLNSWQTANVFQANTGTRWIATSGATWQMTGVQLEVGSSATGFEYRQYGTELALCQRYFYRHLNASASTGYNPNILATRWTTNQAVLSIPCPVPLRTTPSISKSGTIYIYAGGTSITLGSVIAVPTNYSVFTCYPNVRVDATGILGSTAWVCEYDVSAYFEVSAEL